MVGVMNMRIFILLALMVLSPVMALADVQWHKFGTTGSKEAIDLGRLTVTVETQTASDAAFPGDDLILTVPILGHKTRQYNFTSAYGYGAIAIHGDILLLKYGVGRGTFARVDHVKALRLGYDLQELVDVQSSCYVITDPHNAAPDLFVYQLQIQTVGGYTTLSFSLTKPQKGIPSQKIVRLKNDA